MRIEVFYIILISFISNISVYLIYLFILKHRILNMYSKIKEYENKISSKVSQKRRSRFMRKFSKDIQAYYNSLRLYLFLQTFILMIIYIIDLLFIISNFSLNIIIPPLIPFLINSSFNISENSASILIFIISFFIFTPLSLRRIRFD
jgi:hypothetical protein